MTIFSALMSAARSCFFVIMILMLKQLKKNSTV